MIFLALYFRVKTALYLLGIHPQLWELFQTLGIPFTKTFYCFSKYPCIRKWLHNLLIIPFDRQIFLIQQIR